MFRNSKSVSEFVINSKSSNSICWLLPILQIPNFLLSYPDHHKHQWRHRRFRSQTRTDSASVHWRSCPSAGGGHGANPASRLIRTLTATTPSTYQNKKIQNSNFERIKRVTAFTLAPVWWHTHPCPPVRCSTHPGPPSPLGAPITLGPCGAPRPGPHHPVGSLLALAPIRCPGHPCPHPP